MVRRRGTAAAHTTRLALREYDSLRVPRATLSQAQGERLWRDYGAQVRVAFPSIATGGQWELTALGWVGTLPLSPDMTLDLLPRVPIARLFALLEIAWDLPSLRILNAPATGAMMEGFFERLALVLARRVLALSRTGPQQRYAERMGELPTLRGRLDVAAQARHPWRADLPCTYHERTADVTENRIPLWALHVVLGAGLCTERSLPTVRAAYRALAHVATLTPITSDDIAAQTYHRLNAGYRPLHALCRFIITHTGPAVGVGAAPTLPFLVSMPRLFERFVAAWLAAHLPPDIALRTQVRLPLANGLAFIADGVVSERATGQVHAVLDTKYTAAPQPTTDDIAQVVAYARALGCPSAWLVYPQPPAAPLDVWVGETRVRSLGFALTDDPDAAGAGLLHSLLGRT